MNKQPPRIELPPEAEPARDFVEALVARYERRIEQLQGQVESLTAQVRTLTERVQKLTPQNSSLPPSSQHPHAKPAPKAKAGPRRKRGGQAGHKRHLRELIPSERCDAVIPCHPAGCRRCGGELQVDATPRRHQVWELPPIRPVVTEYQIFGGHCPACQIRTAAPLPDGAPGGQCGPRLAAFTGLLLGHFRQSRRRTASFLCDLLNVPCSPAWAVKIQNLVGGATEAACEELRGQLATEKQLFVDESPTKQAKEKAWLWVAVAPLFAVFGIFANRKRESLLELVGNYQNTILNCDRAKMYLDAPRLQWCWAHLKRDIQRLIDSGDSKVARLGHDLIRQQKLLFQHWRAYKAGETTWEQFQHRAGPIRERFDGLLLRGKFSGHAQLVGFCGELYPRREHLWTFLEVEGVEPTNNAAERALRPAVIARKLSFGTQSAAGSRFLERMLTVSETCRLQGRNTYEYLVEAMEAKFAGRPAPSLLPAQAATAEPAAA